MKKTGGKASFPYMVDPNTGMKVAPALACTPLSCKCVLSTSYVLLHAFSWSCTNFACYV